MGETLVRILPFVLPPVLGAVIGYVTNAIAIKMLFRPLTEKRIFGLRLPLTPGIIPRQRYQLAESIGRMVSTQLLTSDTVRSHVQTEGFRSGVRTQIAQFTDRLLDSVPVRSDSEEVRVVSAAVQDALSGLFSSFIRSESFERISLEFVRRGFDFLSTLSIRDILPRTMLDEEESLGVVTSLLDRIFGDRIAESLVETGASWVREQVSRDAPIGEFLSDQAVSRITLALSRAYEPISKYVLVWLESPDVREDLSVRGKSLLRSVLERLNFFQRLLVSAGQYDRTLSERMPAIIDDLIASIREAAESSSTKGKILDGISGWLQRLQKRGVREACDEAGIDIETISRRLFVSITSLLVGPAGRKRIARALNTYLHAHFEARIVDVLTDVFLIDAGRIETWVADGLRRVREREAALGSATSFIRTVLSTLLVEIRNRPLREIIQLTTAQKNSVDDFITERISGIMDEKLPDIVATFDVHRMVVEKINALDVEAVEQLLLMVISRQLKWINLFGALLGALIGGGQVVLGLVTP